MPSPVGHILAGAAVYLTATREQDRSRATLGVILLASIVPDFDFLPGILIGEPGRFHHGISHSFTFAALFGGMVFLGFLFFRPRKHAVRMAMLAFTAYGAHLILDLVSVSEGARGIPIIWPLSDEQFAMNLNLFGHFHHGGLNQGIWSVIRWDNLPALLRELLVVGSPVLFLLWRERSDTQHGQKQFHRRERREQ